MTLAYYTLSSNDPNKYNVINTNIQFDWDLQGIVKMTVISLTTMCNIETLNNKDYIKFNINNKEYMIYIDKSYSKLSLQTIPYILNECFKNNISITCELNQLDILEFINDNTPFQIIDISYNLKLLTGLYYYDFEKPIDCITTEYFKDNSIEEIIDLKSITFQDLSVRVDEWVDMVPIIEPPNANGYKTIFYAQDKFNLTKFSGIGCFKSTTSGTYDIKVEVRNKYTPENKIDFTCNFTITVCDKTNNNINDITLRRNNIILLPNESIPISYKYDPPDTNIIPQEGVVIKENGKFIDEDNYEEYFEILINSKGFKYIIGKKATEDKKFYYEIFHNDNIFSRTPIIIKPLLEKKTRNIIIPQCVGMCLSTPILYLNSNIGGKTFRNENIKEIKIQSSTTSMIINNSYSPSFPIVAENTTIYTEATVNQLTNLEFRLVDANMKDIKLLNPMYITLILEPMTPNDSGEIFTKFEEATKELMRKQDEVINKTSNLDNNLDYHDYNFYKNNESNYEWTKVMESMKF